MDVKLTYSPKVETKEISTGPVPLRLLSAMRHKGRNHATINREINCTINGSGMDINNLTGLNSQPQPPAA